MDTTEWTDKEWANNVVDTYADGAWRINPQIHCSPIPISYLHNNSLQIQVPSRSMLGKIARRLVDDINTWRGLQHDDTVGLID